jgi:hypothetical protein
LPTRVGAAAFDGAKTTAARITPLASISHRKKPTRGDSSITLLTPLP